MTDMERVEKMKELASKMYTGMCTLEFAMKHAYVDDVQKMAIQYVEFYFNSFEAQFMQFIAREEEEEV